MTTQVPGGCASGVCPALWTHGGPATPSHLEVPASRSAAPFSRLGLAKAGTYWEGQGLRREDGLVGGAYGHLAPPPVGFRTVHSQRSP